MNRAMFRTGFVGLGAFCMLLGITFGKISNFPINHISTVSGVFDGTW